MPVEFRICFVGDSFVNGAGDPACLGWAGRLCAAARDAGHDITFYNLGIRRETSADIAGRWLAEVERRLLPEYDGRVVFSFGVNDTTEENGAPRVAPADSLRHARAVLTTAAARWPTLMVGPLPIDDAAQNARSEALARGFDALCAEIGVPYLDLFTPLGQSEVWEREVAAGDGAHPGAGGYAAAAALVAAWPAWQAWFAER